MDDKINIPEPIVRATTTFVASVITLVVSITKTLGNNGVKTDDILRDSRVQNCITDISDKLFSTVTLVILDKRYKRTR
jgi:hypothetical protein